MTILPLEPRRSKHSVRAVQQKKLIAMLCGRNVVVVPAPTVKTKNKTDNGMPTMGVYTLPPLHGV